MKAPTEDLYRALPGTIELRAADDGGMPTLDIRFARFNVWNRIRSVWEGDFMERLSPGAFVETMAERAGAIKALFDHGHDPSIGNKVLGPITEMGSRADAPFGVVDMLDTSYNRDLIPGIQAGVYGASYRFRVTAEQWDDEPGESEANPLGLPERTIERVDLYEFGPVTFPADEGTTVGVRSLTDHYRYGDKRSFGAAVPDAGTAPGTDPSKGQPPPNFVRVAEAATLRTRKV